MRSKFYCRVVIFLLAALFLNTQFVYSQNPCGNSSPTTQPTNFQISNRNQNGFDINFSVDNAANAFAILRSTSSTPVNLSSLVNGTDITVGQTIDNSTVIFLSQTRNAYNTASLYNYGMRYENAWAWNQQTESFIYRESSLTPNTEYYYTIISFNACDLNTDTSPNNILPHHYQYNKVNPLTGSTATCLATPDRTQISLSNRTGTGFELTIPKIDGASSYSLFAYTNHGLSNSVSGSPFNTTAFSTATGTISATGIAANTILYYKVVANPSNSNVCSSAPSHAAYSYRFAVPGDLNSQYIDNKVIIGCPAPTQTPTNLVTTMQQSGVENYISASFTGTSEASGYIVLHSSSNNPPTIPDGASKPSIGGSSQNILIGGNYYWVTSNTSATSVSNKSLGGVYGTTIYTWVIPYTQCADGTYKFYNSTPLTNTIVGCPSSPLTWSTTNATSTRFSVTFPFGGNNKVDVSTASDFSSFITNSPFSVTNTSANTISGLSPSTTYYARSYTVGSSCNSSYSSTKTISTLSPVVSSVSVTNGTYLYNSNIDIVVATNLSITPVRTGGVPSIDITIGSNVRQAVLVNTTASSSLTFRYTVQSSDVDADGISIGSTINLNQGTLKDAGGTNLNLALNSVASTTAVLVDGVPGPALTSLALVGTSSGTALTISYTATFDNSVSGVTSNTFATSYSGNLSGATISSITGSGAVYTINLTLTAPAVTGSGTVYLYLKSNQTSIVDATGKSTISLSPVNGTTYTYTPTAITIPAPTISTTSYLSKYFVDASSDKVGINFPITLPTAGTLPSGTRYNASSWNDAQLEFSFDGTSWTALTTGANYQTIAGVAYKYVDNATARAYQLMIVPISPAAPTVYVRARTKVEDSVNGTFLYSDWTAANQLFSPPPPAVSSARLVLANGVYNVEVTMDKYDANQSVVSFERKQKVLGAANFSTVTIASSNSGFNSNGYGRGGAAGTVYTNYNWNYDLNLSTGNVYQFEVTPIFANSVRGTTYVFAQYLSNGTNSVTGTSLNHAIAVNVDLTNVLTQVSGATLVSTRYQFGLYTAPSTLSYVTTSTVVGTNASTILSSNSNGALVNGSTYRVLGIATLSASGVSFSVPLASVDVIPNPPALTITGLTGVNKEYDGNRTATTTGTAVLNGVANGHTVTLSGTPVFQFADATIANGKAIMVTGYTLSGANAADYSLVQPTGLTANITTKALTITGITGVNKLYDGLSSATLTGTATLSGVVGSESVTLTSPSSFNFASAGVGNGIAITPTTNYSISGTDAAHYTITQPSSLSANITQKGLTISGLSAANKEYNGNTNVNVSGTATYVGLENGESFAIAGSPTYSFSDASVGNNKAINISGFLAPSANYSISQPALTASITGKALIITATGPIMTVGTALTAGTYSTNFTANGTITGEAVTSVTLTPDAAGLSANSPSGTSYLVTPSLATGSGGFLASNYNITYNAYSGIVAGPPVVSSINRVSAANTNQTTVNYTVTFDKAVTGVDVNDFQVTNSGATTAAIASISGSAATYNVVLNTISGDGTIRLDLKNSGTGIQDLEGRAIVSGFTSGQVYTVDQTNPTLGTVTVISSNSNTSQAQVGDVITLNIVAGEAIQTPTVTIAGQAASVTGTGSTYSATYTVTSNTPQGTASISVTYSDLANNPGTGGTSTTNNSAVVVDTQIPTLGTVSVSSNNTNTSQAKVGDVITVNIVAAEAIQTPTVTVAGQAATVTGTGSTYAATYTVTSNTPQGTTSISVTYSDIANNAGIAVTSTTNNSSVVVDTAVPTLGTVSVSSSNANTSKAKIGDVITVNIVASEAIQTPIVTVAGQAALVTGTGSTYAATYTVTSNTSQGTTSISVTYSDIANNAGIAVTSTTNSSSVVVDIQAPTGYSFVINQQAVTIQNQNAISVNLTGAEVGTNFRITSNVGSSTISTTGIISSANQVISNLDLTNLPDGNVQMALVLTDASGNAGGTYSQTISKDALFPTVSNVSSSLANGNYTIGQVVPIIVTFSEGVNVTGTPVLSLSTGQLSPTQVSYVSGNSSTELVFNYVISGGQNSGDLSYSSINALSLNGGTIVDNGNNAAILTLPAIGAPGSLDINAAIVVDTQVPTLGTVSVNSSNANTSKAKVGDVITVNIVAAEAIQTPTVSIAGQAATVTGTGSTYTATYTVTNNTPQGTASISVTYSDVANNPGTAVTSTTNSSTVVVDTQSPTLYTVDWIPASIDNVNFRNVSFTLSNAELGATYSYIITSGTSSLTASGTVTNSTQVIGNINTSTLRDGIITLSLTTIDQAGNTGLAVTDTINKATNGGPTGTPTPITLSQNAPDQSINLLAGITDPEGDPLTVSNVTISYSIENVVTSQPVVINSTLLTKFQDVVSASDLTGTNLFIEMSKSKFLNGSQKGQINIAYVVTDGNNSLNANAVLNIIGANDQPTGAAVTLNQVVINGQNMGIPLTEGVGVSTNVPGIDPDDDSVTYTLGQNTSVSNGQFVFNSDGSFNFLPNPNYYGEQEFDYYIKDQSGVLNGPYKVKIIIAENPDIDGIPSKLEEVAPNGGDVNGDGIPDRKQNNITNVPLGSYADFKAGIDWANGVPGATRPSTSKVGSLLIGSLPGGKSRLDSLDLDPNAKFRNVALLPTPNITNTDRQFSSDLYQFTIEGLLTNAADTLSPRLPLRDLDPSRPGLQVRAVLEFPVGMKGSTYLKQNKAGEWKSFKDDQKLSTYDDGATLIDLDNDPSTIERIVLTFTDGAFGDRDTLVNNSISDPGGLGIIKPVIDDATLPTRAEGVATSTALFNVFDRNSLLDKDEEGQKLYYTIDSTNNSAAVRAAVKIDSLTGVISVRDAGGFDYESFVDANGLAQFKIVVKAIDTDGNFDLATFTQTITNVDEYPRIISGKTVSYREQQPITIAVIKVQTLPDYQDLTSFSILSGLDGSSFTIDAATGVLRFKNSPFYDVKAVYSLDIQSQDLSGKTDHAVFTVNIIDIDADNDGILDDIEFGPDPLHPIDTDKDGIPDYLDTDSDGDGIPDLFESKADTDKDGIPDYLDTDSDGDGILDKIEAGPNPLKPLDSDGDGIPDFRELDADNDGYLDSYEKSIDTDKDGIPDFQDTDSDGDGILDKVEDDLDFGNIKDCDHDGIENRIDPDVCDLILPQIITPNGDGLNDVLKIPGIMRLQPNHITIINRWGAVVYDAENYQNTWGGTGDSGELPDGTYYYVVDFKGAKPTISNFIYLDRTGK